MKYVLARLTGPARQWANRLCLQHHPCLQDPDLFMDELKREYTMYMAEQTWEFGGGVPLPVSVAGPAPAPGPMFDPAGLPDPGSSAHI